MAMSVDEGLRALEDEAAKLLPKGYKLDYTGGSRRTRWTGRQQRGARGGRFAWPRIVRAPPPGSTSPPLAEARELMQCCSRAQHRYTDAAMVVTLDPKDGRPLYLQIVDEVRRALVVGSLRPEDPLPSVRDLAAQLVVNPRTVSQAYGELERQGVVYVRRGQGTFVSADAQPDRKERRALAREVARRALREAWRNGVGMEELVKSIREVAQEEGEPSGDAAGQGEKE